MHMCAEGETVRGIGLWTHSIKDVFNRTIEGTYLLRFRLHNIVRTDIF